MSNRDPVVDQALTIPSGSTVSDSIKVESGFILGLMAPSGGYAGTKVYLQASNDNVSFLPVYDPDGAARWSLDSAGAGAMVPLDVAAPFVYLKVETDAQQGPGGAIFHVLTKRWERL